MDPHKKIENRYAMSVLDEAETSLFDRFVLEKVLRADANRARGADADVRHGAFPHPLTHRIWV